MITTNSTASSLPEHGFNKLFRRQGFEYDNVFDWTIQEFLRQPNAQESLASRDVDERRGENAMTECDQGSTSKEEMIFLTWIWGGPIDMPIMTTRLQYASKSWWPDPRVRASNWRMAVIDHRKPTISPAAIPTWRQEVLKGDDWLVLAHHWTKASQPAPHRPSNH